MSKEAHMGKSNKARTNLRHYPFGHNALQGTRASGVYPARQSPVPGGRLLHPEEHRGSQRRDIIRV
ncbi:MAG: hypothetical protein H8D23_37185 [Candidatus Brocadiales bacterium]|nr:hypothetical protein [Candidatus Brocadiales bacterium]